MAVAVACPSCGSDRLYKDGLRYLSDGTSVQRWLCRNCGYRFTDPQHKAKTVWKNPPSGLNPPSSLLYSCQGNDDPDGRVPSATEAVQTLAKVEEKCKKRASGSHNADNSCQRQNHRIQLLAAKERLRRIHNKRTDKNS